MELFGAVNRQFKTLFNRQLECTTFFQYDNAPEGTLHFFWKIVFIDLKNFYIYSIKTHLFHPI